MKLLKTLVLLVLLVIGIVFAVNNVQSITINFFGYITPPLPLFLVILVPFAFGFLLQGGIQSMKNQALRRQLKQLHKQQSSAPGGSVTVVNSSPAP